MWSSSVWTSGPLPRTEGTQKLKRKELQRWAAGETPTGGRSAAKARPLADIVGRHVGGRALEPDTTLEELGLSSLDRVELMMELEEAFHTTLDESMLTGNRSLRELEQVLAAGDGAIALPDGDVDARIRAGLARAGRARRHAHRLPVLESHAACRGSFGGSVSLPGSSRSDTFTWP